MLFYHPCDAVCYYITRCYTTCYAITRVTWHAMLLRHVLLVHGILHTVYFLGQPRKLATRPDKVQRRVRRKVRRL